MLVEHRGARPQIDASAYVAPNAVVCGDVHVGADARILLGAVVTAEDGRVQIGARCIVMEHALVRGRLRHPAEIGDDVLVGPHAHVNGATIAPGCFVATGVSLFPGARLGAGCEVRVNAVVRVDSTLAANTTVPNGWVAVGDPAQLFSSATPSCEGRHRSPTRPAPTLRPAFPAATVARVSRSAAAALVVLAVGIAGCGERAGDDADADAPPAPLTVAVIGDTPYGDAQEAAFPRLVDAVNRHPAVDLVLHVGDIKTGDSTCTAKRFRRLRRLFDAFADPFVVTPGDNEWTDCHREAAGGFRPAERLSVLRRIFYPRPGRTLGARSMTVRAQTSGRGSRSFPENQLWTAQRVVFSTVHVVGSNNGRDLPGGRGAFARRLAAALAWIDETFRAAGRRAATGVVIALHADMFAPATAGGSGFEQIVRRLERRARAFDGPVLLLSGDTHRFRVERPLERAPNLRQVIVEGETAVDWLQLDVDPGRRGVFSFVRRQVD